MFSRKWFVLALVSTLIISVISSGLGYVKAQQLLPPQSKVVQVSQAPPPPASNASGQATNDIKEKDTNTPQLNPINCSSGSVSEAVEQQFNNSGKPVIRNPTIYLQTKPNFLPGRESASIKLTNTQAASTLCAFLAELKSSKKPDSPNPATYSISSMELIGQSVSQNSTASQNNPTELLLNSIPDHPSAWPIQARTLIVASFVSPPNEPEINTANANLGKEILQNLIAESVYVLSYWFLVLVPILAVLAAYLVAALALVRKTQNTEQRFWKWRELINRPRYLDPIVITSGQFGKASLSQIQVFWFSLIVLGLLVHILLVTGRLSGLSEGVLTLLGISLTGTAFSRIIDGAKQRLTIDNWTWVRKQGWLTAGEKGYEELPKPEEHAFWADLIKTDGVFDVYHFQMVAFSILVGMSLLFSVTSSHNLEAYSLPSGFLLLLGMANTFFIFGKVIDPKSFLDLNQQLDRVRQADLDWRRKLLSTNISDISEVTAAGKVIEGPTLEKTLSCAEEVAPEEALKYFEQAIPAATLLKSLFSSVEGTKFKNEDSIDKLDVLPSWLKKN
jgi:hypothetical protein